MSATNKQYGFMQKGGVDWSRYLQYRPLYPSSYFERLFDYHAQKPGAGWSIAHDVGAGAGICSGVLSHRFEHVMVSDPNEHVHLARRALIEDAGLPASKFTFLRESAEHSTASSGSVDMIVAAECIHWTDTRASLEEFHRELKAGGSLLVSAYTKARLPEHKDAEQAWDRLFPLILDRAAVGDVQTRRAFGYMNTALAPLEFPEDQWESVKRVYINTRGRLHDAFFLAGNEPASNVKPGEDIEWMENAEGWTDRQGIDWLKGHISTYIPRLPEEDVQHIWSEIEASLKGKKTLLETPVVMILATKKK